MKYLIISLIGLFAVCMTASAEEPFRAPSATHSTSLGIFRCIG